MEEEGGGGKSEMALWRNASVATGNARPPLSREVPSRHTLQASGKQTFENNFCYFG